MKPLSLPPIAKTTEIMPFLVDAIKEKAMFDVDDPNTWHWIDHVMKGVNQKYEKPNRPSQPLASATAQEFRLFATRLGIYETEIQLWDKRKKEQRNLSKKVFDALRALIDIAHEIDDWDINQGQIRRLKEYAWTRATDHGGSTLNVYSELLGEYQEIFS